MKKVINYNNIALISTLLLIALIAYILYSSGQQGTINNLRGGL